MKKRILAVSLALSMLALGACQFLTESDDPDATTTTTQQETSPDREGAVMPPLQGGPMLYTFRAAEPFDTQPSGYDGTPQPVFHFGLVNDMGEMVVSPRYEHIEYIRDANGRISGLFAFIGREITHYALDGTATALPFSAAGISAADDGRHWAALSVNMEVGEDEPVRHEGGLDQNGLFDSQTQTFVIPPTDGLWLWARNGVIVGNQYESSDFGSPVLRSFLWNPEDGSEREFPEGWTCQGFFPETGWFEMVEWSEGGVVELFVVDEDMNIVPDLLTQWHIDARFDGGEFLVVRDRFDDSLNTWVGRDGAFSELRFDMIQRWNRSYIAWNDGMSTLFDGQLNVLHETAPGESFTAFSDATTAHQPGSIPELIVLQDEAGAVLNAWDTETGREFAGQNGRWLGNDNIYVLENGQWNVIDVTQFREGDEAISWVMLASEYGLILQLAEDEQNFLISIRHIAIDWQGNLTEHPLLPFFEDDSIHHHGENMPGNYFWIEGETQRGFVNIDGEWLFVEE